MQETTDVWLAAFLAKKGYKIDSYDVISRGRVRCKFNIPHDEWNRLKLEFNNSEIAEYKALIGKVRDLGY